MGKSKPSRRSFIQSSVLAAAGIAISATRASASISSVKGWTTGMQINPDIDNLRVVACCDPLMESTVPKKWDTQTQNKAVDSARVSLVLDAMACSLAKTADPKTAWSIIFRKPSAKAWQDVKVAIKVNCAGSMHPRAAIIDKVCRVLNSLGVPFANMTVYDMVDDAVGNYKSFVGTLIPSGVSVSNQTDTFPVTVNSEARQCSILLQNADILVNCGTNKPHNAVWAGITMTCKNHVGTVVVKKDNHGANCPASLAQLLNINKHECILGTPSATVPCRQQLCIVDSLWSSDVGDWSAIPNTPLGYLVMGTFGPAVDYLTTKKIREQLMKCTHDPALLNQFISAFGYTETERVNLTALTPEQNNGRGWVLVPAAQAGTQRHSSPQDNDFRITSVEFRMSGSGTPFRPLNLDILNSGAVTRANIFDASGKQIRILNFSFDNSTCVIEWDGETQSGGRAGYGRYFLRILGPQINKSIPFVYR